VADVTVLLPCRITGRVVSIECRLSPVQLSRSLLPDLSLHQGYIENVITLAGFAVVYFFLEGMNPEVWIHVLQLLVTWALTKNDRSPIRPTILVMSVPASLETGGLLMRRLLGHTLLPPDEYNGGSRVDCRARDGVHYLGGHGRNCSEGLRPLQEFGSLKSLLVQLRKCGGKLKRPVAAKISGAKRKQSAECRSLIVVEVCYTAPHQYIHRHTQTHTHTHTHTHHTCAQLTPELTTWALDSPEHLHCKKRECGTCHPRGYRVCSVCQYPPVDLCGTPGALRDDDVLMYLSLWLLFGVRSV
jgi:hypothetical protein